MADLIKVTKYSIHEITNRVQSWGRRKRGRLKMQLVMRLELKPDSRIKRRLMWLRDCGCLGGTFDVAEWEDKEERES